MSGTLIGWLITIAFVLLLTAGFFVGFWRGLKRSTVNLAISIIGVIIAFFVAPVITNAILGTNIIVNDTKTSIENILVELLRENQDINAMMTANKSLEIFFTKLPGAIVNVLAFIILTLAIELFVYVIYKILALTCFRIKEEEKKHALSGGAIGLVKTFLVALLAFMPLASLTGIANNLMVSQNYGITSTIETEVDNKSILEANLPKTAKNIIEGLENNMLIKMCGIFGLDDAMFDYYGSFEIDKEKLYIRKEINSVYKIVDFSYQVSKYNLDEINYVKVRYDKLLNAVEDTTESTLFKKVLSDTVADIIINYYNYSFLDNSIIVTDYSDVLDKVRANLGKYVNDGISYKYFKNDLTEVINAFKVVGQSGMLNNIINMNAATVEEIASLITNDQYSKTLENAVSRLVNVNVFRDAAVTLIQEGLDAVSSDLERVGVQTDEWTDDDWNGFASSVSKIIDDFGDITREVDVFELLEDPTVLLDKAENYDILSITSKLGDMLDEIRANKMLQTLEDKSIIDNLLSKNNVKLPEDVVKDNIGNEIVIDNYTDYFAFIQDSLVKIRDEGVYEVVNNTSLTAKEKLLSLATIISKEGNENLLSEIILPLYQLEPTKTVFIEELTNSIQSELVNVSSLSTLEDWDYDLKYLSQMLINLNSLNDGTQSFLSIALDGDVDSIVDKLTEENVEKVVKPILYAKSTSSLKEKLFASIKSQIDNLTGGDCTISTTGVTLLENNKEDQTDEICTIIKALIKVDSALDGGATIRTVDSTLLGTLLNSMRDNAYRFQILVKTETGIFKNAFIRIMDALKTEYKTEVEYIQINPNILYDLGVDSLEEENYWQINYIQLLNKIRQIGEI